MMGDRRVSQGGDYRTIGIDRRITDGSQGIGTGSWWDQSEVTARLQQDHRGAQGVTEDH